MPLSEGTLLEKLTIVKFWQSKGKFSCNGNTCDVITCAGNTLFNNGQKVILL